MHTGTGPVGEEAHATFRSMHGESVTPDRRSPPSNQAAERMVDDHDIEPTRPAGNPTLNAKI
jgi:hypothetical protein